jgi:hypothetical protein
MSFGAGAAQAEVGAYWLVSGKKITTLEPELQASLENKTSSLLTKLSNKNIHILCTAASLEETHLIEPNGVVLGKAVFTGCIFLELPTTGATPKKAKY